MSQTHDPHALHADALIAEHGVVNASAAALLVIGPRALRAFNDGRVDPDIEGLLRNCVAAWVEANGGCHSAAAAAALQLEQGATAEPLALH